MMYVAAFCTLAIVGYMLSCMFHKEPKRYEPNYYDEPVTYALSYLCRKEPLCRNEHHDEFFRRLSRDSDPNATIWRGKA